MRRCSYGVNNVLSIEFLGRSTTYGGYSDSIVVDENFVLRIPSNLKLAAAAPLLCAGIAAYRTNELPFHLSRAIENGVTKSELIELITHLAFYSGWPAANTAVTIARKVFADV